MEETWIRRKPEYEEIVSELVETEGILAKLNASTDLEIVCLLTNQAEVTKSGVKLYAKTEKVPSKFQWCTTARITITVFYPNIVHFSEEQIRVLLFRELLKIQVEEAKDGSNKYKINDFDMQDFTYIVDRFGANWAKEKTLFE